eukprot:s4350_g1.t1
MQKAFSEGRLTLRFGHASESKSGLRSIDLNVPFSPLSP